LIDRIVLTSLVGDACSFATKTMPIMARDRTLVIVCIRCMYKQNVSYTSTRYICVYVSLVWFQTKLNWNAGADYLYSNRKEKRKETRHEDECGSTYMVKEKLARKGNTNRRLTKGEKMRR
jgi:hypothetical protein